MKPENLVSELINSLISGARLIFCLIVAAPISTRLTKAIGHDNLIVYCLIILALAACINEALGKLFSRKRASVPCSTDKHDD